MCRNIRNAGSVALVRFGAESTHIMLFNCREPFTDLLDCMSYTTRFGSFCNLFIAFIVDIQLCVVAAYAIRSRSLNANETNERMNERERAPLKQRFKRDHLYIYISFYIYVYIR